MISDKKRVTVMLHDCVTPRLIELAAAMKILTNELANRFIEGCIQQIDQKRRLLDPSPIVELVRKTLSLDLPRGDRFLQWQLQKGVCAAEKCLSRCKTAIRNHLFCSLRAFVQLELRRWRGEIRSWYAFQRHLADEVVATFIQRRTHTSGA